MDQQLWRQSTSPGSTLALRPIPSPFLQLPLPCKGAICLPSAPSCSTQGAACPAEEQSRSSGSWAAIGAITGWVSARGHNCLTHCRRSVPTYVCCRYTQLNKLHPGRQAPKSPSPTLHFHVHRSKFCSKTRNEVIVRFSLKKSIYWNCLNTLYKFPIQASAPWLRVNANTKAQTSAALQCDLSCHLSRQEVSWGSCCAQAIPHGEGEATWPSSKYRPTSTRVWSKCSGWFLLVTLCHRSQVKQRYKACTDHQRGTQLSQRPSLSTEGNQETWCLWTSIQL